jgi:peptide/nickel transport system substrate-binding protein
MVHRPRWVAYLAVSLVAGLIFLACTPAAPTTAPTGAPTGAPTEAPTEAPTGEPTEAPTGEPTGEPTGAPTGNQYPTEGEVTCASGDTPGEYNGVQYNGSIRLIEATDDQTVVFHLCAPDVAFLQKLAFIVFGINDSEWLEQHGGTGDLLSTINGTGPLRLDEWRRGDSLLFSAFEGYWGDQPLVPNAVLRWATESATRLTEIQAGPVHGITNVGPGDFDTVRNDPNLELVTPPEDPLNIMYVGMNRNFEPWSDINVRRAVGLAIDRQRVIDNFYPEGSEVASHFTPCALEFACEGDAWPDYDPAEATRLISEATGGAGIDTVINFRVVDRGYLPLPREVATDIAAQLAEVGIRAAVEEQESGTFIGNSNAGALEGLFLLGWGADYPEVTNFLDFHFGPGCTSGFGPCYPEIAGPLARGNSTADPAVRQQAYEEANNAIRDLVPMVPVAHGGFALAYQQGVQGAQAGQLSNEYLWAMAPPDGDQIVFMQNAEPISVYCADETDGESLRACIQSMEGLYGFGVNSTDVVPKLATSCDPNEDATVWTCQLRPGVTFHNGATFEAQDVLLSLAVQWDAAHPLHTGNTGAFEYWPGLWGDFLNAPPAAE